VSCSTSKLRDPLATTPIPVSRCESERNQPRRRVEESFFRRRLSTKGECIANRRATRIRGKIRNQVQRHKLAVITLLLENRAGHGWVTIIGPPKSPTEKPVRAFLHLVAYQGNRGLVRLAGWWTSSGPCSPNFECKPIKRPKSRANGDFRAGSSFLFAWPEREPNRKSDQFGPFTRWFGQ
jgi:hypothetical protein